MGPALCLFSAACFGAMAVFGKLAYDAGVTPVALLLVRFALAALLLGGLVALRPIPRIPGRLVLTGLGLGALGYATQATLYFSALDRIDASLVALVLYTYPALVTVGAVLLGRDRMTPARTAALVVASLGTLLVLLGAGGVRFDRIGVGLAFGAALTYTVYILVADAAVHRVPPVVLAALVMTGASLAIGVRAAATGVDLGFAPAGWFWIVCIAVVSTVAAMLAFFAGLRRTGPSTASILSTFEPVVTTALATVTLGELLTPLQLVGALLVLSSAIVVQMRSSGACGPSTSDSGSPTPIGRSRSTAPSAMRSSAPSPGPRTAT